MRWKWPLVLRSTFDAVQRENYTLRDALRNANGELRKHRVLIADLASAKPATMRAVEKAMEGQRR